jgi:hypothetical protein
MLDFHAFKLLQARRHALSQKMLILRMYAYLRDAESKSFYNESMTEGLWDHLALLTEQVQEPPAPDHHGSGAASEGAPKCSHCYSATIHKHLKIDPARTSCPFLELPQTDARKAAGTTCAAYKDNGGTFQECCQAALESFK